MRAVDVILMNLNDPKSQLRLREEFERRPHTRLSRDEFAAIMLQILPRKLRLRRIGA